MVVKLNKTTSVLCYLNIRRHRADTEEKFNLCSFHGLIAFYLENVLVTIIANLYVTVRKQVSQVVCSKVD